ncbi:spermidine/putrescine transport system ATP-binding protein [Sagittula marina]|uniref:Spermidine/putrescine import ATP-binding protein PotA n=1 Tax=Sagittula marina TaxID=943940 RepID=A0A7W6DR13_9RHOB|nr:ABC transporter ATP-binding protein [Sagittula marina]MBB3987204.1 spermidine/putrescine transport system ATP-binding protein [Sagittula marina]
MQDAITINGLTKSYPGTPPVRALKGSDLSIRDNEFFTLLGPSGCGKTTLLRLIAGFEVPTDGTLKLFGENISKLPPEKRPVNTVFQHYSLFPHMNVLENVAYGLLRQGKPDARRTAQEMLDLVHLGEFAKRRPSQLSGGQQQRVALARALAPHPRVLLLDEPLSALDLKLRQSMRAELKRLQRETGITFVFVTHDQEEALSMSDRIAVMSQGEIQQVAKPAEIYEYPATRFVAEFIGDANFFEATPRASGDSAATYHVSDSIRFAGPAMPAKANGGKVTVMFRPEKARIVPGRADGGLGGTISDIEYLGNQTEYRVTLDDGLSVAVRSENRQDGSALADVGSRATVEVDPEAIRVLVA